MDAASASTPVKSEFVDAASTSTPAESNIVDAASATTSAHTLLIVCCSNLVVLGIPSDRTHQYELGTMKKAMKKPAASTSRFPPEALGCGIGLLVKSVLLLLRLFDKLLFLQSPFGPRPTDQGTCIGRNIAGGCPCSKGP